MHEFGQASYATGITKHIKYKLQHLFRPLMPTSSNPMEKFDELTATARVTIYLYKHPKSGISQVIKNAKVGQKAAYGAKAWLEQNGLLLITKKEKLPYTPVLSLSEKGMKVGEYLCQIEKILQP